LVIEMLNRHGVRYVIIGGVAATLHGSPLRAGDTDICPDSNPVTKTWPAMSCDSTSTVSSLRQPR
jgi:hypothetical protein